MTLLNSEKPENYFHSLTFIKKISTSSIFNENRKILFTILFLNGKSKIPMTTGRVIIQSGEFVFCSFI